MHNSQFIWQAIDRLECNGTHVMGITADGAPINRKLFWSLVHKATICTQNEMYILFQILNTSLKQLEILFPVLLGVCGYEYLIQADYYLFAYLRVYIISVILAIVFSLCKPGLFCNVMDNNQLAIHKRIICSQLQ